LVARGEGRGWMRDDGGVLEGGRRVDGGWTEGGARKARQAKDRISIDPSTSPRRRSLSKTLTTSATSGRFPHVSCVYIMCGLGRAVFSRWPTFIFLMEEGGRA
jgi:hypothetical protein